MTIKILIVDDDIWITKVFTKILLNLGYTGMTIVNNGFDAVATALETRPDLIFLDLLMPEIDGLTTLKMLKKIPATSNTNIIICTGNGDIDNLTKAMALGATDFISKPFTADTIKEKIAKISFDLQKEKNKAVEESQEAETETKPEPKPESDAKPTEESKSTATPNKK